MIKIRNLWKKFGHFQVFSGLDVEVRAGETLVVLGPSGIGKSVLLKHIIGLLKPDAGEIEIAHEQQIGMLFQGGALFDSMSVEDNVAFYLKEHREETSGRISEVVAHALELVGLAGTQKKMPAELSGGMRKRVAMARLIVYRPKILLYDEPTAGLDPMTAMQINELIVKTQQELQATSIVVTHDMFSALYVGDRLALMREGKIAHIEEPDQFVQIDDPLIRLLYSSISQNPRNLRYG